MSFVYTVLAMTTHSNPAVADSSGVIGSAGMLVGLANVGCAGCIGERA